MTVQPSIPVEESSIADVVEEGRFKIVVTAEKVLIGQELQAAFDKIRLRNRDHFCLIGNMKHWNADIALAMGWERDAYDRAYQHLREQMDPYLSDVQKEQLDSDPPQYATGAAIH